MPLLAWLRDVKPPADFREMQALAPWPDWRAKPLPQWPQKYEAWLNTHFALRAQLIRAHGIVRQRWLAAPAGDVLVGRDDWLFYSGNATMQDFVGRDPLNEAQLALWLAVLEGRRAWLRERGIAYLFVLAPNKSTIYPEKLPALLRAQARPGKMDQLLDYLRAKNSTVPVLDLRPALLALKSREPAYWATDSHWNGAGLAAACDAINARVAALGLPVRADGARDLLNISPVLRHYDCIDLLAMRGHWPLRPEPELRLRRPPDLRDVVSPLNAHALWKEAPGWKTPVTTERDSGLGHAALLCDSFFRAGGVPSDALAQVPFMLNFRRYTSLWEWATFDQIRAIVELEKPEIVIEQWTERFLKVIPADHPEFARARAATQNQIPTSDWEQPLPSKSHLARAAQGKANRGDTEERNHGFSRVIFRPSALPRFRDKIHRLCKLNLFSPVLRHASITKASFFNCVVSSALISTGMSLSTLRTSLSSASSWSSVTFFPLNDTTPSLSMPSVTVPLKSFLPAVSTFGSVMFSVAPTRACIVT